MTAEQRFFPIWKMCLCAAVVLSLMGCAAKHGDKAVNSPDVQAVETTSSVGAASVADSDSAFEDYDDEESEAIADPLEGWNRFWFGFNDVLLLKVVKPVYPVACADRAQQCFSQYPDAYPFSELRVAGTFRGSLD